MVYCRTLPDLTFPVTERDMGTRLYFLPTSRQYNVVLPSQNRNLFLLSVSLCVESSARMLGRFEGVVEMLRSYPVDTGGHLINLQWRRKSL